MKKIIAMILAAMMILTMSAAVAEGKLEEIQKKGVLTICTDAAWAPFEYIGANGDIVGADIEIAEYIAEQLGVTLEKKNIAFDNISITLMNDEADLSLSAMTITNERKETLDAPISASRVRALLEQKDADTLRQLVPPTTFAYLEEHFLK